MENLINIPNVPNSLPEQGGFVDYKGEYHRSTSGASTLDSRYPTIKVRGTNVHDTAIFLRTRLYDKSSQEYKDICQIEKNGSMIYIFKKDAVKLYKASRLGLRFSYADKADAIEIEYLTGGEYGASLRKNKAYFMKYEHIALAGIFKLGEQEFLPEKLREKYAIANTIYYTTGDSLSNLFFVSSGGSGRESIFKNLQVYSKTQGGGSDVYMSYKTRPNHLVSENAILHFCPKGTHRTLYIYALLTEGNSVYDHWKNDGSRIYKQNYRVFKMWNEAEQVMEFLNFSTSKFDEIARASTDREHGNFVWKSSVSGEERKYRTSSLRILKYQPTGEYYGSIKSAQVEFPSAGICPHCNELHDLSTHDQDRCRMRNARPMRFDYHSQQPTHDVRKLQGATFKVGVEIEKEDFTGACYNHREIFDRYGWVKERDGSLDSQKGYELVSPMFDLMKTDLIEQAREIESKYPRLINGEFSRACGGHIHFSKAGESGRETLESICGYLPLIYAIYKHRTERTYCQATEKESMKFSSDKYQAVRIFDNRIEFRIFPAVKNIETLEWRLDLLRVMASAPTASPVEVVNTLMDESSELYKLFARIFDKKTIYKRAVDSLKNAKKYDRNYFNIDFSQQIIDIETKAVNL
jgi:hypothetical protein